MELIIFVHVLKVMIKSVLISPKKERINVVETETSTSRKLAYMQAA